MAIATLPPPSQPAPHPTMRGRVRRYAGIAGTIARNGLTPLAAVSGWLLGTYAVVTLIR
jgi:hypothetical protein